MPRIKDGCNISIRGGKMKAQTTMFGRMVKKYEMPLEAIEDINLRYEEEKTKLNSFGSRLAGRLDSEN